MAEDEITENTESSPDDVQINIVDEGNSKPTLKEKIKQKWSEMQDKRKANAEERKAEKESNQAQEKEIQKEAKAVEQKEYFEEKKKIALTRAKETAHKRATSSGGLYGTSNMSFGKFAGGIVSNAKGNLKNIGLLPGKVTRVAGGSFGGQTAQTGRTKHVKYVKKGKHYVKKTYYTGTSAPAQRPISQSNPLEMFKLDFGSNRNNTTPNTVKSGSAQNPMAFPKMNDVYGMNIGLSNKPSGNMMGLGKKNKKSNKMPSFKW